MSYGFRVTGIGPAKRAARVTGGYVDLVGFPGRPMPGYRKSDFGIKSRRPRRGNGEVVEKRDPERVTKRWAQLRQAWEQAPLGEDKRAALQELNLFERRHGLARERARVEVEIVNSAGAVASATGQV